MKKLLILIILFLLSGCNKVSTHIDLNKITNIKYKDTIFLENDYKKIIDKLNQVTFYKTNEVITPNFIITTNDTIFNLYVNNNKIYYSKNQKTYSANDKFIDFLDSLYSTYNDGNFYNIIDIENYFTKKNDLLINLDNNKYSLIISLKKDIYNFKIYEIEYSNGVSKDINTLYSNKLISKDQKIVINKKINENMPDIRISFNNEFNYNVSIIPIYNENKDLIIFDKKENS